MTEAHRKTVKHFEGSRHLHELTFSCYQRKPLLTNDVWRSILARSLKSASVEEGFDLIAFVFMPEHVHLLVAPHTQGAKVSRLLARTKQPTSKQIKVLLNEAGSSLVNQLTVRERPGKYCFRFWQEGPGFDRNIFSAQAIEASLNYIHENPVKRGLCKHAADWKWSSARFHEHGIVDEDLPVLTRPAPGWFDRTGVHAEHS
jgi:putative transposase